MAALAATAVAAPQVIGGGKYHTAAFEVKIPVLQRQRLRWRRCRPRLESIPWRRLHLPLNPIRVDTGGCACLKSVPRQVLGKPVTRDLRASPALPPQR